MPREEWKQEMIRAVPDSLLRDIVNDSRRGPAAPSSLASSVQSEKPRAPSGGTTPIQPPPGIKYVDQLCDAADRRDRAVRVQQEMEAAWIEGLLERGNPHKAKIGYDPHQRFDDETPSFHRREVR
jgi:hypothetical protein